MSIRRTTILGLAGVTLIASAGAAGAAQPDGLYSADALLDADVYVRGGGEQVGEIDDVVLDNDMSIQSFVVETETDYGLDGKSYVVSPDQLSVETLAGESATEPAYRITLNADARQLARYPVYNNGWWHNAQAQAVDAWQQTKDSAASAWTQIKQGTADLVDSTREAVHDATADDNDAAASASDTTQNSVDENNEADRSHGHDHRDATANRD